MRLFADADFKFIENRTRAYVISGVLIVAGLLAMLVNVFTVGSWQRYGVDFTGGSLVRVRFENPVSDSELRAALGGSSALQITPFPGQNEFVVRAPLGEVQDVDVLREQTEGQLTEAFGAGNYELLSSDLVGPKIGAELQQKAVLAVMFSFILTLVYLAIRFETRFGLAAVLATAHDIILTLGFLAAFRIQIELPIVAAVLTVLGYSLNDKIVVFDRIRENMTKKGAKKVDQVQMINRSINETLPRTIITSTTTLVVLVALVLVGPLPVRDFAIVLVIGIVAGTYSSQFIASPLLVEIRRRLGEGKEREKKKPRPQPATV
jgi:preprotein translocase subunit SecF